MGFLANKKALITGVASNRSIAWGVAQAMHREGAELAFTYVGDKLKPRVEKLAGELGSEIVLPLDVGQDADFDALAPALSRHWDGVDIVVHSIAFGPQDELKGSYVDNTTREGFRLSQDISAYSFVALARALRSMMGEDSSMITMTYLGAERALPSYNVMGPAKASLEASVRYMAYDLGPSGIRVNGLSAGPIKTLAAAGIGNFRKMLDYNARSAPLRRNVTTDEVGNVAAFLCSDLARGITGEVVHVDSGFHIVGLPGLDTIEE
ncbi:enoyl-[acyl-carrier protein] reductase I [Natronocella acetinitrilica]|uniref:Enoyl-[acyl-carrier-protein] reductase [NADH] n=1 Tax=Natronocella acetinitrilica TaxID=414046 RepID=A0AAE3G5T5_9GAMM|nr:enoyl-ACP reductase [Natronocella acetinitrilica]MCP1676320.1 enoyl-[acyl-carrier protein] reductase I [Natronocella acetinitrilica]